MVYQKKPPKPKKYTDADYERALQLKLNGTLSDRQIQRETGVPAQTLRDHLKKGVTKGALGRKTILTLEEERMLVEYVFLRQDMHAPIDQNDLCQHIADWLKNDPRIEKFGADRMPGE